jgi:excisionase family DNA binding protein
VDEVANYLNYAKATIYGLSHKRELLYIKTGKKLLFKKKDNVSWLEDRKVKTKSDIKKMADDYIYKNPLY